MAAKNQRIALYGRSKVYNKRLTTTTTFGEVKEEEEVRVAISPPSHTRDISTQLSPKSSITRCARRKLS